MNTEQLIHAARLMRIDPQECAGNLDQSLTGVLNAFHSIYDAVQDNAAISIDWNEVPATSTILAIRNARHHNIANRIGSLETYFTRPSDRAREKTYQLISFGPEPKPSAPSFMQALSWDDLTHLLLLPRSVSRLGAERTERISAYLNVTLVKSVSEIPAFFDILPLVVNAGKAAVSTVGSLVQPLSIEGETFLEHFSNVEAVDLSLLRSEIRTFPN